MICRQLRAAALAVIDFIEKNHLVNNAARMGDYLAEQLEARIGGHRRADRPGDGAHRTGA